MLEGFALSYYCQGFVWWRIICYTFLFETEKKANCHCFRLWQFFLTFLQTVSFHLYLLLLYFRNTPDSCPRKKTKNQIITNCISNCVPPFQTNVSHHWFKIIFKATQDYFLNQGKLFFYIHKRTFFNLISIFFLKRLTE